MSSSDVQDWCVAASHDTDTVHLLIKADKVIPYVLNS